MNQAALGFINQQFDFEYEDQPDSPKDYSGMINYIWQTAQRKRFSDQLKNTLTEIVNLKDDPTLILDPYFLPGKHEVEDILKLALERMPDATT